MTRAGWEDKNDHRKGYGLRVEINHGNGNRSVYGHLSRIDVKSGDTVSRGQIIGLSGNTGGSTGPHLHYGEMHRDKFHDPTFDPENYRP